MVSSFIYLILYVSDDTKLTLLWDCDKLETKQILNTFKFANKKFIGEWICFIDEDKEPKLLNKILNTRISAIDGYSLEVFFYVSFR